MFVASLQSMSDKACVAPDIVHFLALLIDA